MIAGVLKINHYSKNLEDLYLTDIKEVDIKVLYKGFVLRVRRWSGHQKILSTLHKIFMELKNRPMP